MTSAFGVRPGPQSSPHTHTNPMVAVSTAPGKQPMTNSNPYRQGDVLLVPIEDLPANLRPVPLEDGRTILARGEITGHAHAVVGDVELLQSDVAEMDERFLRVLQEAGEIDAWECHNHEGDTQWIPAYEPRERLEAAGLTITGRDAVAGSVLEHEEHMHMVLPPGIYRVERQAEYTPGAIRNVAD